MRNCSEDVRLHARGTNGTHAGPMARTRARWHARGTNTSHVDPILGAWTRWYARGRRPGAYLGVGVRVAGLTRIVSGSCASGTPGQVSLGPSRRPPCPGHAIVSVCYRSGLYCGRHAALRRDLTAPRRALTDSKRGNCASRGRMRDLLADDCAVKRGELHH